MVSVLYDGWPLIYEPDSLPGLHLLTLLANLPPQVEALLALPGPAPPWLPNIPTEVNITANTPWSRMIWEHQYLPRLIRRSRSQLLHLTTLNIPFLSSPISITSPATYDLGLPNIHNSPPSNDRELNNAAIKTKQRLFDRIRGALSQGGLVRALSIFWPEDLPAPGFSLPTTPLPPVIHPDFNNFDTERRIESGNGSTLSLPDTFTLYHGPYDTRSIHRLLQAWSWAAGPIGDYYPLLLLGLGSKTRRLMETILAKSNFGDSVIPLPSVSPPSIPSIYQKTAALIHPTEISPWDGPLRFALACGKPVVSVENPYVQAIVGPAAYLAPMDDHRTIGAAIITVIVDEDVSMKLSKAATQQAASWINRDFSKRLQTAYKALV